MRKLAQWMKLLIVTLGFFACNPNGGNDPSNPTNPQNPVFDGDFAVTFSNITQTNANFKIVPKDANFTYTFMLFHAPQVKYLSDEDVLTWMKQTIDLSIQNTQGFTYADFLIKGTYEGSLEAQRLKKSTEYTLMVVQMNDQGEFPGNLTRASFTTLSDEPADPTDPTNPTGDIDKSKGVLPGLFSISATKKVRFSKGNLQYIISSKTWRFADEQYEILGLANIGGTKRDLFGWGTGNNPLNDSKDENDYPLFHDWGLNTISNASGSWHTLSKEDWKYLAERTMDGYILACVNGINGIILFPDNWTKKENMNYRTNENVFSDNTLNVDDWRLLENNGAVFMPCAGIWFNPDDQTVSSISKQGDYWTSTKHNDLAAYDVLFSDAGIYYNSTGRLFSKLSVRLVQDAN